MHRTAALLALSCLAASSYAADGQRVPAQQVIAAAQAALAAKAAGAQVDAHFASVGHVEDVSLVDGTSYDLRPDVQESWLRPRVGVPVQVFVGDRRMATVMTWFAVTAPVQAATYGGAYARGTPASGIHARTGSVDLARTHGVSMPAFDAQDGRRLRRAVLAGEPVLSDDFEAVPDVRAQQVVRVDATSGPIHLSTPGHALVDGRIGQVIAVLPDHASQPVRARVVSNKVVSVEN